MDEPLAGRCANWYDRLFGRLLQPVYGRTVSVIRAQGCRSVVDMGCGTGALCRLLHAHGMEATGVDISPLMVAFAGVRSPPGVAYVQADATDTGLETGSFDGAVLSLVLHPNPLVEQERLLDEAARLVGGGVIVLADYGSSTTWRGWLPRCIIHVIESLAVTPHRRNYYAYMRRGGLAYLLSRRRWHVLTRYEFYGGAVRLLAVRPPVATATGADTG
ncbi:MAG TPA: class I SAM-dependent methyltransferase [Thermoplasmatales archaeon]|nr:class I SAM-dependent methyltransferase [Thermoplasmatales archaeon]